MGPRRPGAPAQARLSIRVDCVVLNDTGSPYHRIGGIGGRGRDGKDWRLSEDAAIAAIELDRASFYVEWPKGHRIDILVAQGLGKRYLKAETDGESPDRLLALPECD
jgi:Protein of unknown function (DUF3892)